MSLSARIAIDPSRRIARWASAVPACGLVVACETLALRWPAYGPVFLATAMVGLVILAIRLLRRPASRLTLMVSASSQVEIQPAQAGVDASWCLAESTMAWPGFAIVALRPADESIRARVLRFPVLWSELAAPERRALGRFLVWSLSGHASAPQH